MHDAGTAARRPKMQFGLRGLLVLMAVVSLALAFVAWRGGGVRGWVQLLLIAILPTSIVMERWLTPQPRPAAMRSCRSVASGLALVVLFGLPAAASMAGWCGDWWVSSSVEVLVPFLVVAMTCDLEKVIYHGDLLFVVICGVVVIVAFALANSFALWGNWPRPLPRRILILLAIVSVLHVLYTALDWPGAMRANGLALTAGLAAANLVVVAGLWGLCWWRRRSATRVQALLVAALLFVWLVGLAFPMGGWLLAGYIDLNLFGPHPAPSPDLNGWAQMRVGLTEAEVEQLLGKRGSGAGPYWHYVWHTPLNYPGDDRSYVVRFDEDGRVTDFRAPVKSQTGPAAAGAAPLDADQHGP